MCLTVNEKKTKQFKKDHDDGQDIVVWKVYAIDGDNNVVSPVRDSKTPVQSGRIVSNRPTVSYPFLVDDDVSWERGIIGDTQYFSGTTINIHPGIHVCLSRQTARKYKKALQREHEQHHSEKERKFVIFRCSGVPRDFVAAGYTTYNSKYSNMAVFIKIYIKHGDWKMALKGDFR